MRKILLALVFSALTGLLFAQNYTPYKIEFYNTGEATPVYSTSSDVIISVSKTAVSINNSVGSVFNIKKKDGSDIIAVEREGGRIVLISITKEAIAINYGNYILNFLLPTLKASL